MSKVTNDGLTRSGMHRMLYSCTHMATVGVKGLIQNTRRHEADLDRYILSSQNIFWSYGLHGKGTCRNSYSVTVSRRLWCKGSMKRASVGKWRHSAPGARMSVTWQSTTNRRIMSVARTARDPRKSPGIPSKWRHNRVNGVRDLGAA